MAEPAGEGEVLTEEICDEYKSPESLLLLLDMGLLTGAARDESTFWAVCERVTELPDDRVHLEVNVPAADGLGELLTSFTEYKSPAVVGSLGGLDEGESDIEWRPESSVSWAVVDDEDDDEPLFAVFTGLLVVDDGDAPIDLVISRDFDK